MNNQLLKQKGQVLYGLYYLKPLSGWRRWTVFLTSLCLTLTMGVSAFAAGPGTTTAELLKIPVGTRAIGMGEAFTALADDSSAMYWNPAGLSRLSQKEATFMHSSLLESVHYEHLAFVAPTDNFAFGTNFSYLGYGDIAGFDNSGAPTGNVSAYSYILNGGLSRSFFGSLSLGASGGLIHESLADNSANTFAMNAGALYTLDAHPWSGDYHLGLAVQNLGPGLKFVSERDPLPRKIKIGAAAEGIKTLPLNLTADVTVPNDNDAYVSLGSEYWFKEIIALRLGYAGSNDEGRGLRVGFGLKYSGMLLDYAYAGFGDFGATNRISLSMRFGEKVRQLNSGERAILKEAKASEKDGAFVPAIIAYNELLDQDPANDHILHYMIKTYDKMYKAENVDALAEKSVPIPSPEDAAMAELLPEVPSAATQNAAVASADILGDDPLNLNKLPEVSALDVSVGAHVKDVSAPKTPSAIPDLPPSETSGTSASPNAPALSPADIYGN